MNPKRTCDDCHGLGYITAFAGHNERPETWACPECNGSGEK